MDFANLFTMFIKSGMQQDPETNQFTGGIAEMSRLAYNIQEERDDEAFFNRVNNQEDWS